MVPQPVAAVVCGNLPIQKPSQNPNHLLFIWCIFRKSYFYNFKVKVSSIKAFSGVKYIVGNSSKNIVLSAIIGSQNQSIIKLWCCQQIKRGVAIGLMITRLASDTAINHKNASFDLQPALLLCRCRCAQWLAIKYIMPWMFSFFCTQAWIVLVDSPASTALWHRVLLDKHCSC